MLLILQLHLLVTKKSYSAGVYSVYTDAAMQKQHCTVKAAQCGARFKLLYIQLASLVHWFPTYGSGPFKESQR